MGDAMKTPTLILIAGLSLVSNSFAVDPPPDGGYPGGNTAEGAEALLNLTTGTHNSATGYHSLLSNTTGNNNTATGYLALQLNTTGNSILLPVQVLCSTIRLAYTTQPSVPRQ